MGRGLPREGVGAKTFGMSLGPKENQTARDIPGVPEKFEKKMIMFNFGPQEMKKVSEIVKLVVRRET